MNRTESYDDPMLANRVRAWMEVASPAAAPERLVFSVMDDVQRSPRPRRFGITGRPILSGLVRYAALTLVITIGVAGGIILSRGLPGVGGPTVPPPTPSAPVTSLTFLGAIETDGRLLASGQDGAWLETGAGELVHIDGATLAAGEPIHVGFAGTDLIADTRPSAPAGQAEEVWLVGPADDLLRFDPAVGALDVAPATAGSRLTIGADAAWVSRAGKVLKVDADQLTILRTFEVPGHRAVDPILVVGTTLWAADPSGIERLDALTGAPETRLPIIASSLIVSRGLVWIAEGARLAALDPDSGETALDAALPSGISEIVALATRGDTVWLATGPGPDGVLLIGVDAQTGQTTSLAHLTSAVTSIAVVGNQVWTLGANGQVGRFEAGS